MVDVSADLEGEWFDAWPEDEERRLYIFTTLYNTEIRLALFDSLEYRLSRSIHVSVPRGSAIGRHDIFRTRKRLRTGESRVQLLRSHGPSHWTELMS